MNTSEPLNSSVLHLPKHAIFCSRLPLVSLSSNKFFFFRKILKFYLSAMTVTGGWVQRRRRRKRFEMVRIWSGTEHFFSNSWWRSINRADTKNFRQSIHSDFEFDGRKSRNTCFDSVPVRSQLVATGCLNHRPSVSCRRARSEKRKWPSIGERRKLIGRVVKVFYFFAEPRTSSPFALTIWSRMLVSEIWYRFFLLIFTSMSSSGLFGPEFFAPKQGRADWHQKLL